MPLDPDRWGEVERLFARAADLATEARRDLLDRECGDAEVRREVEQPELWDDVLRSVERRDVPQVEELEEGERAE